MVARPASLYRHLLLMKCRGPRPRPRPSIEQSQSLRSTTKSPDFEKGEAKRQGGVVDRHRRGNESIPRVDDQKSIAISRLTIIYQIDCIRSSPPGSCIADAAAGDDLRAVGGGILRQPSPRSVLTLIDKPHAHHTHQTRAPVQTTRSRSRRRRLGRCRRCRRRRRRRRSQRLL